MYVCLHVGYRVCKKTTTTFGFTSLSSVTGVNKMLHNALLLPVHKMKDFSKHQLLGQHALKYYS